MGGRSGDRPSDHQPRLIAATLLCFPQPQLCPEQRPEAPLRDTRSCSCSAAQLLQNDTGSTCHGSRYSIDSASCSVCGAQLRVLDESMPARSEPSEAALRRRVEVWQKPRSPGWPARPSSDERPVHRFACVRPYKVGRVWPRGTVPWLPSAQNHLKSRPGNPTHRVEQRGSGYELIHDIRVRRDT